MSSKERFSGIASLLGVARSYSELLVGLEAGSYRPVSLAGGELEAEATDEPGVLVGGESSVRGWLGGT